MAGPLLKNIEVATDSRPQACNHFNSTRSRTGCSLGIGTAPPLVFSYAVDLAPLNHFPGWYTVGKFPTIVFGFRKPSNVNVVHMANSERFVIDGRSHTIGDVTYAMEAAGSDGQYLVAYGCRACQWFDCTPLYGDTVDAMDAAIKEIKAHHAEFHNKGGC